MVNLKVINSNIVSGRSMDDGQTGITTNYKHGNSVWNGLAVVRKGSQLVIISGPHAGGHLDPNCCDVRLCDFEIIEVK